MTDRRHNRWRLGVAIFGATVIVQTLAGATLASAQATRTWVSGVGDDANPCSRTAPCKTFAGAISKTATGGEISVLDPGGFGALTITKSITISGNGNATSILASGTNGINVNGANITVRISGLEINGNGTGLKGINFIQGKSVIIDDVDIYGFSQNGIFASAPGTLMVRNSRIDNNVVGIGVSTAAPNLLRTEIVDTNMDLNGTGLLAGVGARVAVRNCTASHNSGFGLRATGSGLAVDTCTIQNNPTGLSAESASAVKVKGSTLIDNGTGLNIAGGSSLLSGGGNTVEGNGVNGAFNGTYTEK